MPTFHFDCPADLACDALEKACALCEQCGAHAVVVFERMVCRLH
jgi:hypothetical protein